VAPIVGARSGGTESHLWSANERNARSCDHPAPCRPCSLEEYELKERAGGLTRKLRVIDETTHALTDIIDTERSIRLEATIVALIVVELLVAFYDIFWRVK
jgi:hypothetical protein